MVEMLMPSGPRDSQVRHIQNVFFRTLASNTFCELSLRTVTSDGGISRCLPFRGIF
jgi:hypothetical protein